MSLSLADAISLRARGVPRSFKEFEQSLRLLGVLRNVGFQGSARNGFSLDGNDVATPWWSFSATEWVKARVRKTDRVFEYGSGGSSLWLAARSASVVSVEHDATWRQKIVDRLPPNAEILLRPSSDEFSSDALAPYAAAIRDYAHKFEIIVIDGMERNACAILAAQCLTDDGIVIFDNSHRSGYRPGMKALAQAGLRRIDMAGCVTDLSTTSIFLGKSADRWLEASIEPEDYGT